MARPLGSRGVQTVMARQNTHTGKAVVFPWLCTYRPLRRPSEPVRSTAWGRSETWTT